MPPLRAHRPAADASPAWRTRAPLASEVQMALDDPRVERVLLVAVRDRRMRAAFAALRAGGASVESAVGQLVGPYADEAGRPYLLSEERVRGIVYRKGRTVK